MNHIVQFAFDFDDARITELVEAQAAKQVIDKITKDVESILYTKRYGYQSDNPIRELVADRVNAIIDEHKDDIINSAVERLSDSVIDDVYNALESFRTNRTFSDEYDYYESVLMTEFIRDIQPGVKLYRDRLNGIAWAEDHRTGLGISVHPNIDETGSIDGMVNLGYWRKDDRVVKSHGWIYNIDRLAYDSNDPIETIVASECRCAACLERKKVSL